MRWMLHEEAVSKKTIRIDYSLLPDEELARTAATMVFIWLGRRALQALADQLVVYGHKPQPRRGGDVRAREP